MARQAWSVFGSYPWFQLLDSLGVVQNWLAETETELVDRTVLLLTKHQNQSADRVADLLNPYLDRSGRWNTRLQWVARRCDWDQGSRFLKLMLRLIDTGVLDESSDPRSANYDFWSNVYGLHSLKPTWGCEVAQHYFNRRRKRSLDAGQRDPFSFSSGSLNSEIAKSELAGLAEVVPAQFVHRLFPFMCAVIEDCATSVQLGLIHDSVWASDVSYVGYGTKQALFKAMEKALSALARLHPDVYQTETAQYVSSHFLSIQYLLLRSLVANSVHFANIGVDRLLRMPGLLSLGSSSTSSWPVKHLIGAMSLHCCTGKLKQLELLLLEYYPSSERSASTRRWHGYSQFVLLSQIDAERRSDRVIKRLKELRRKFDHDGQNYSAQPKVERITSPIPETSAERMKDAHWLLAMRRYDKSEPRWVPVRGFVGGAIELSRILENQATQAPNRFANLALVMPDDVHPCYFESILRGISDVNLDIETVVRVCKRCHRIPGQPIGNVICRSISSAGLCNLPQVALDLVAWYATHAEDPPQEWSIDRKSQWNGNHDLDDMLTRGVNTTRGSAAWAIGDLIDADPTIIMRLRPVLEELVQDPSVAVRSCVAKILLAVLAHERDLAVRLFTVLCNSTDALLQTRFVVAFLYFALPTNFQELSQILERMIASQISEVASAGSRQACLASLDLPEASEIANRCLSGTEALRVGAAQVMADHVVGGQHGSLCERVLIELFDDSSSVVRAEASKCFMKFERDELGKCEHLIEQFISSDAFPQNYLPLMIALVRTTARLPEISLAVCERFIDVTGVSVADMRTSEAGHVYHMKDLVFRIYQQDSDIGRRSRCLDLIDKLLEYGAFDVDSALKEFER